MNWLDLILILVIIIFTWRCFWLGLIKSLGSFAGLIIGFIAANFTYLKLFSLVGGFFGGLDNIGKIACFLFLFILLSRLIYMIFVALDKLYDFISILPFLGVINNIGGGILGLIIGIIFSAILVILAARFFPDNSFIGKWLIGSFFAEYLAGIVKLAAPAMLIIRRALNLVKHGFN